MKTGIYFMAWLALCQTWAVFGGELSATDQVDLRPEFCRLGFTPRQQGSRLTCSLFAITSLAEFQWARVQGPQRFSEEFLIWAANKSTGLAGDQAMFNEAIQGLRTLGACSETLMPYQTHPDNKRRPSKEALADAQSRTHWSVTWIKPWDLETGLSSDQICAIKQQLAHGCPVAAGLRWPQHPSLLDGILKTPPPSEVFDGHSILFVGYKDDESQPGGGLLLFRNSAGEQWGQQGYAWMPYAYASQYCNDALTLQGHKRSQHTFHFEAEDLKIASASKCQALPQDMTPWGRRLWENGTQLFCRSENGGVLELEFTLPSSGRARLELFATFAPNYGALRVLLDDSVIAGNLDFHAGRVHSSGPMDLGLHALEEGKHRLRFVVIGKNDASPEYHFGLDAIRLHVE